MTEEQHYLLEPHSRRRSISGYLLVIVTWLLPQELVNWTGIDNPFHSGIVIRGPVFTTAFESGLWTVELSHSFFFLNLFCLLVTLHGLRIARGTPDMIGTILSLGLVTGHSLNSLFGQCAIPPCPIVTPLPLLLPVGLLILSLGGFFARPILPRSMKTLKSRIAPATS